MTTVIVACSLAMRSSIFPTGKKIPSELDPVSKEVMQSALNIQSKFLDILCSTTPRHLPHCVLELRHAETTTSASQLEEYLQAAPAEQFPGNHSIIEQ
jgi:hypothetical protein